MILKLKLVCSLDRSDSEYEKRARRSNPDIKHLDSDDDTTASVSSKKKKQPKSTASKRKPSSSRAASPPKKALKKTSGWCLESDSDDDVARYKNATEQIKSAFTKRVADGVVRRTADLTGDLFVELRLYNIKDIRKVQPKDRWEKATLSLKYQADNDAPELVPLREFVRCCKKQFTEEGVFFADKK
ncbi:uncharacterized protein LOC126382162 isoform X1 [Pectinophora gossypiella]|uniref:uncharacterized protein LOC126372813 isoform X1 n=1 Tax=Pectinophora gossypiella TaxID=13191 RepID=UPI00214F6167|nr:uncharacterized protein LOC126372813 isoform X1 [Pectinophora gossypiella]XP_049875494.1 uncharacterized protein LOC126373379 isoform X1 [Pectinophora gossypiella]XP_049876441.1 uncharacterized protein LOC126374029 isoform X1 [Pectinophora gossypiella]XP_049886511.1 uncharacterized protein LOC126380980 isoform X1 [Pectinophora gossypiella]XP_049887898.1 uncharacterized protein LOC126382162 isoform X1 [Pectinophora gossypiella]